MDIKDVTGLSGPLKRLIAVIASGVGTVFTGHFIKSQAKAKAFEIRTITDAINGAKASGQLEINYSSGEVKISTPSLPPGSELEKELELRAFTRLEYQALHQQGNIEAITSTAARILDAENTNIALESPEQDWISRFFEYSKMINSDEMQELWGKILAGEIVKPGSYSLRTLDAIRNLSKNEAHVFEKVARAAFRLGGDLVFVPYFDRAFLSKEFNIQDYDRIILVDIGLLYPEHLSVQSFLDGFPTQAFTTETHVLVLEKGDSVGVVQLPILKFTQTGSELARLVVKDFNQNHFKSLRSYYTARKALVKIGKIRYHSQDGGIHYDEIQIMDESL